MAKKPKQTDLKPKQRDLAQLMVDEPKLTNVEYANRIGIDPKTLYKWKKTAEFIEYRSQLCKEKFKDLEALAMDQLKKRLVKGDMRAITYVLDGAGYKASETVEIKDKSINITIED